MAEPNPDHVSHDKMLEILASKIQYTDEISFKLLGLVPLLSGAGLFGMIFGTKPSLESAPAIFLLSLFGAAVTLGLFWWELRNIQLCLWYIRLAETLEQHALGGSSAPDDLTMRPPPPGGMGKRGAEKLVYSATIVAWISMPIVMPYPILAAVHPSAWVIYAVVALAVLVLTGVAVTRRVGSVNHPGGQFGRKSS